MAELELPSSFEKHDIKTKPITGQELEELKELSGDYQSLFSRRAKLYQERMLKDKMLKESDYRNLILEHYTFLKRPVIVNKDKIFIGNSSKTVAAAKISIQSL